jgi:predicted transcriptional regulator
MYITFEELRKIKHSLPTGSVKKIADEVGVEEQTVRNYFGAMKYEDGRIVGKHLQPGPGGGIVHIEDDTILTVAKRLIADSQADTAKELSETEN